METVFVSETMSFTDLYPERRGKLVEPTVLEKAGGIWISFYWFKEYLAFFSYHPPFFSSYKYDF